MPSSVLSSTSDSIHVYFNVDKNGDGKNIMRPKFSVNPPIGDARNAAQWLSACQAAITKVIDSVTINGTGSHNSLMNMS